MNPEDYDDYYAHDHAREAQLEETLFYAELERHVPYENNTPVEVYEQAWAHAEWMVSRLDIVHSWGHSLSQLNTIYYDFYGDQAKPWIYETVAGGAVSRRLTAKQAVSKLRAALYGGYYLVRSRVCRLASQDSLAQ